MKMSEEQYRFAVERIEVLLKRISDASSSTSPEYIELSIMSDIVEEYEQKHHSIEKLTIAEVIKQGLKAKGMTQKELAEAIGLSTSRISDFTKGKSEPSLETAGKICRILGVLPEIMMGF